LQATVKSLKDFGTSVHDYVGKLRSTKIGTPIEQFQQIQDKAFKDYKLALTGDQGAMGRILSDADSYVQAIQDMYGSSDKGQAMLNEVANALEALPEQITMADYIKADTEATIKGFEDTVKAINNLGAGFGIAPIPVDYAGLSAAGAVTTSSTAKQVTVPTTSSAGTVSIKELTLQDVVNELKSTNLKLDAMRKDNRHATEAIIDGNFLANGMAADKMTDATRTQTIDLVYSSKVNVGLV